MRGIVRCLVMLAVAGHIGLTTAEAFAAPGYGTAAWGGASDGLLQLAQSTGGNGDGAPGPGPGTGGHGGGSNPAQIFVSTSTASGACATELQLPDASAYPDAVEGLAAVSAKTQDYLQNCGCPTQACVADALDKYAVELKKIAPRLPRTLRSLPQVVAATAKKVRAAPSLPAAVRVVTAAVATVQKVVRKAITLMRAADPDATAAATRGGEQVAHTLDTAATALERAETL